MIELYAFCLIVGPKFSPARAQQRTGIELTEKHEPGEIGKKGAYRNRPVPYGSGVLRTKEENVSYTEIEQLAGLVGRSLAGFRECGAEDIKFELQIAYQGQCNLEFQSSLVRRIADLGIPWCLTVYQTNARATR